MNKLTYQIIGGATGLGVGFLIGSIACDIWLPEFEEVEKGPESVKTQDDRFARAAERARNVVTPKKGDGSIAVNYNAISTEGKKKFGHVTQLIARTKEDGSTESLEAIVEKIQESAGAVAVMEEEVIDPDAPLIISVEEYGTVAGFKTTTVNYYVVDDTLTDMHNQVVYTPEKFLPEDVFESFGEESGDDDVVFIRNPKMKCDYEVIRLHESFAETVLGVKPAPTTKVIKAKFDDED